MIRITGMIALAAFALAPAGVRGEAAPQNVLVVVAHPDDELFMAPAIAALARQGAQVAIYYATRGEAGPGVSGLAPGSELAERRIGEAWCAVEALNVSVLLGAEHGDGKLGVAAHHEGSPARDLAGSLQQQFALSDLVLIPSLIDQNPCAHCRMPMDMIRQGWSTSLFQAKQQ